MKINLVDEITIFFSFRQIKNLVQQFDTFDLSQFELRHWHDIGIEPFKFFSSSFYHFLNAFLKSFSNIQNNHWTSIFSTFLNLSFQNTLDFNRVQ